MPNLGWILWMNQMSEDEKDAQSEVIRLEHELKKTCLQLEDIVREKALYKDISDAEGLPDLLDALGRQIGTVKGVDGYMINLIDPEQKTLVCEKVCLPDEYKGIEKTFLKLRFSLIFERDDPNVISFNKKEKVVINIHEDNNLSKFELKGYKRWKIFSLAVIPIFYQDQEAVGTILVYSQKENISESMVGLVDLCLNYFCRQLGKTMRVNELVRMEQSLKKALKEQKKFLEFIEGVSSLIKVDEVYQVFMSEMLRRYGFEMASVFMKQDDQLVLQKCLASDLKYLDTVKGMEEYFSKVNYDINAFDGATATAFCQKTHILISDVMQVLHLPMSKKDKAGLAVFKTPRTFLLSPISQRDNVVGVLSLISLSEVIDVKEDDVAVIKLLCRFLGASIANAKTYETVEVQKDEIGILNKSLEQKVIELNELATKDRLTELYNFGYFQEELQRRIEEYKRCAGENYLGLVICDIDHFKNFNDTYGHIAGNIALKEVSNRVAKSARDMDIVCRYGGEEFVVILPKCNVEGAQIVAERMRAIIMAEPIEIEGDAITVTISLGCAGYQPEEAMAHFIQRADAALYKAKKSGRNRVEVADE